MSYKNILVFAALLFCTSCGVTQSTPSVSLPDFVTATFPPTAVPVATQTLAPPTVAPTIVPVAGTTTTQVNVRVETSTASTSLGTLGAFTPVQIIGRDASGKWLQIIFQESSGWVRADYVQVSDATAEIPVVVAESGGGAARGVIVRGVNVRNGPGKDFMSLGLLNENDVVVILGKDSSGAWMQIEYAPSPDGIGWVAVEFLQIDSPDAIAVVTESVAATEVPATSELASPAPVVQTSNLTAWLDNDSPDVPIAVVNLSAMSSRIAQVQGEVSAPQGDAEDWVGFSITSRQIVIQLSCDSVGVQVELSQTSGGSSPLSLACGASASVQTEPDQLYLLHILPVQATEQVLIKYSIKLKFND